MLAALGAAGSALSQSGQPTPPAPPARALPPASAASAAAPAAASTVTPAASQRVEITGGRQSDTEERRRSTAAKIVIGREEIDKFGDATLGEVLRRLPGVTTPGAPGRGGPPRLRGLGGGYTQLLIDGQRIPPGFSLESLTPEQVERIEILRAPTAETGARAIAGTINIITREGFVRRFPIGPVAAITPFNFPLNLVAHKVAPAIAAGCPFIVKPASQTPGAALALAQLIATTAWPRGACSVLPLPARDAATVIQALRGATLRGRKVTVRLDDGRRTRR